MLALELAVSQPVVSDYENDVIRLPDTAQIEERRQLIQIVDAFIEPGQLKRRTSSHPSRQR